jgi:hypothetical protein
MLTCTDGDPTCDADGLLNGVCLVNLNACVGEATAECMPGTLSSLDFTPRTSKKLTGFVAPPVSSPGSCGVPGALSLSLVRVPKHASKPFKRFKASKKITLVMKARSFVNKLSVQCLPCTRDGCGPVTTTTVTTTTTTTTTMTTTTTTTTTTLEPPCPLRESPGLPYELTLTVPATGSDLDNGWTGTSHNFPIINGTTLRYCLGGCDGKTTFECTGKGATGAGSINGPTFGAPLPLLAAGVPVCIVNRFQTQPDGTPVELDGTFNLQTGEAGTNLPNGNLVPLLSDLYLRTTFPEVCPRCDVPGGGGDLGSVGKCSATAKNAGDDCLVDGKVTVTGKGLYLLSSACTPLGDAAPTSLDIQLPLTTGTAKELVGPTPCPDAAGPQTQDDNCSAGSCSAGCTGSACVSTDAAGNCIDAKGGISQLCCSNNTSLPCFPTKGGGKITRTGKPVVPGDTTGGVFAGTFCITHTDSGLINQVTGLPGPGALLLPATAAVTNSQ